MFGLGLPELIIILVIILILFGSTRLPKLSRSIGESARELREGLSSADKASSKNETQKTESNDASNKNS